MDGSATTQYATMPTAELSSEVTSVIQRLPQHEREQIKPLFDQLVTRAQKAEDEGVWTPEGQ